MSKDSKDRPKITDWIQAFGAIIAAIGLVLTLWLQAVNTRYQIDASKRDYDKYINEIAPIVKLHLTKNDKLNSMVTIKVLQNTAFNLNIENDNDNLFHFTGLNRMVMDIPAEETVTFNCSIDPMFVQNQNDYNKIYIRFTLRYEDKLRNNYIQKFYMKYSDQDFTKDVPLIQIKSHKDSSIFRYFKYNN